MENFHTFLRQNLFQSPVPQQMLLVRGCIKQLCRIVVKKVQSEQFFFMFFQNSDLFEQHFLCKTWITSFKIEKHHFWKFHHSGSYWRQQRQKISREMGYCFLDYYLIDIASYSLPLLRCNAFDLGCYPLTLYVMPLY